MSIHEQGVTDFGILLGCGWDQFAFCQTAFKRDFASSFHGRLGMRSLCDTDTLLHRIEPTRFFVLAGSEGVGWGSELRGYCVECVLLFTAAADAIDILYNLLAFPSGSVLLFMR